MARAFALRTAAPALMPRIHRHCYSAPRRAPRAPRRFRAVAEAEAPTPPSDSDDAPTLPSSPDSVDLDGLKKECRRLCDRQVKKVGKATTRLRVARETLEALESNPDPRMEELEACPDVDAIAKDLDDEKDRLARLNRLADVLGSIKSVNNPKFIDDAYPLAAALGVNDAPPPRPQRVKKTKQKQANAGPRKPYWTFTSADGVDIRVGRTSSDNDEVSCNPECRDSKDWWMHAAGCPGSHVVIRYTGDEGPPRETVTDAALLAAVNSKSTQTGKAKVSMVRCRQVSKPRGAKPGLVQLSGDVRTVSVCVKDEADRLERLTATKS